MAKNVCIVTGPLVGLRSAWLLENTAKFAAGLGEPIRLFSLFDEILSQEGTAYRNAFEKAAAIGEILDGYSYQFQDLREKAYCSIARQIESLPDDVSAAIRAPSSLYWRGVHIPLKDQHVIAEYIQPRRIVTIIDAEWKIKERLKTEYGEHALSMLARQEKLDLKEILQWLGLEVSTSEDWSDWCSSLTNKPVGHIVLGREVPSPVDSSRYCEDVEGMAKLITQPDVPSFYASYSMTVSEEAARQKINEAILRLRAYGVVVDPASIEIPLTLPDAHQDVVFAYTVFRDLRWDVQKVDAVVAIHPYEDTPPLSTGMMDELGHARAFRKERYLLLASGGGSPFTGDNYVPANHLFTELDSLFDFLEKKRRPPLKPQYTNFVEAFKSAQAD